jgi:hypothetical protein
MTLSDLSPTFREALALHDIIGTFGIPAEHIFVGVRECKLVVVAQDGEKQYAVAAGPFDLDNAAFEAKWNEAVAIFNASSMAARGQLLDTSHARSHAAEIIVGLVTAGFVPRAVREAMS